MTFIIILTIILLLYLIGNTINLRYKIKSLEDKEFENQSFRNAMSLELNRRANVIESIKDMINNNSISREECKEMLKEEYFIDPIYHQYTKSNEI